MTDVHSKKVRSYNMSRIRSGNTKPEILVRKYLFSRGFRYRIHKKGLPGKPDIVLPKYNSVIFVNGCFWHHHNCGRFVWPITNEGYWQKKITRNVERDQSNTQALEDQGWKVFVIWECELKKNVAETNLEELYTQVISTKNN